MLYVSIRNTGMKLNQRKINWIICQKQKCDDKQVALDMKISLDGAANLEKLCRRSTRAYPRREQGPPQEAFRRESSRCD